jgi:hypothetical protein
MCRSYFWYVAFWCNLALNLGLANIVNMTNLVGSYWASSLLGILYDHGCERTKGIMYTMQAEDKFG